MIDQKPAHHFFDLNVDIHRESTRNHRVRHHPTSTRTLVVHQNSRTRRARELAMAEVNRLDAVVLDNDWSSSMTNHDPSPARLVYDTLLKTLGRTHSATAVAVLDAIAILAAAPTQCNAVQVADIVQKHRWTSAPPYTRSSCTCGWSEPLTGSKTGVRLHAEHVQNVHQETRTIRTVEELDALPANSILLDDDGDVYAIGEYNVVNLSAAGSHQFEPPALPALLLFRPDES